MRDDSTWIQTYSGKQVWPLDPRPEDFDILDIAHALSLVCRYTGHCKGFYSVGQHCCHVADLLHKHNTQTILTGLMHDSSEAYIADIARPIKHTLMNYLEIEQRLEKALAIRFNLLFPFPPCIKEADNIMLNTERRDIMATPARPYNTFGVGHRTKKIELWSSERAENEFLFRFNTLSALI